MSIIGIILVIVVVGVLLWLANSFLPMDGKVKQILNAVVIIVLVIWLLYILLGAFGGSGTGILTRPITR